jgi:hypothetical protein
MGFVQCNIFPSKVDSYVIKCPETEKIFIPIGIPL